MLVTLDLHRRSTLKNAVHSLTIRFTVNRQPVRYNTGVQLTEEEWRREQKTGYPNTKKAIELEEKAKLILEDMPEFNLEEFKLKMKSPLVPRESITKWWILYREYRTERYQKGTLKYRTYDLDNSSYKKVEKYLQLHPEMNSIYLWNKEKLEDLQHFMNTLEKLSEDTTKIYLEAFRTFFTWLRDDIEILTKSPFTNFTIRKGNINWFPYSYEELMTILTVTPTNKAEQEALRWTKLILWFGGSDPMDFSAMRWKQVQTEAIQVLRIKVRNSSRSGKKLVYLTPEIRELFTEINCERKENDEYVLPVFTNDRDPKQNLERHKKFIRKINKYMKRMILVDHLKKKEEDPLHKQQVVEFTIKRLRPTAATIALTASGGDIDYVSKVLMHSNVSQTSVYTKNYPNDEMKKYQGKYDSALQGYMTQKIKI